MLTEKQKTAIRREALTNYNAQEQLERIALYDSCVPEACDFYKIEMFRLCAAKIQPERIAEILATFKWTPEDRRKFEMKYMENMENKKRMCVAMIETGTFSEVAKNLVATIQKGETK